MKCTFRLKPGIIITLCLGLTLTGCCLSEAAVGDGKVIYGNNIAPTNEPKTREFSAASGNWGSVSNLPAAAATINYVLVKASPQADEYVVGVVSSTGPTLYVYTYAEGAWALSWSASVPSTAYQVFDIAYERDSGDCLVVYSNGATSNEISYRKRVDGVWDGASTTLNSSRTTGVVRFVELESRPNTDEIGMAFSDANSDLSAFVWNGANWGSEHTAALSTNLDLATVRSFDLAYEQVSGNLLVAYSILNTNGVGLARKLAGQTTWTNTPSAGGLNDQATVIDLAAEPGSNYIAFSSISNASRDYQMAVWAGTDTAPFNFQYTFNNADTAAATWTVPRQGVANGWAGSGASRRAVFIYRDVAGTVVPYFTWLKSSTSWEQAANTPATYSPPTVSGTNNFIFTYQAREAADELWVTYIDSNTDFWTFRYDGSSSSGNWYTVDDGTAGENAIETTVSNRNNNSGDMAFTFFDPTAVELTALKAQTKSGQAAISWRTAGELRTRGFRLYRTFLPDNPDTYELITPELIRAKGSPLFGRQYRFIDEHYLRGAYYILEEVAKDDHTKTFKPVRLDDKATFISDTQDDTTRPLFKRDGTIESQGNTFSRRMRLIEATGAARFKKNNFNDVKIKVNQEGMYRVLAQDLINAGWDIAKVDPRQLALFNRGQEVPIFVYGEKDKVFNADDFIEFYGEPNSTRYTRNNVYWLKILKKRGLRMRESVSHPKGPVLASYPYTMRYEENAAYYPEFKGKTHWFFPDEFISPVEVSYTISCDHIADSKGDVTLKVCLQGGSQTGFGKSYARQRAVIKLNGVFVGEADWMHDEEYIFSAAVRPGLLKEGENKVTIEAPDEGGSLSQFFLLNWIECSYPREPFAEENRLFLESGAGGNSGAYKVRGFSSPRISAFACDKVTGKTGISHLNNINVRREAEGDFSVLIDAAACREGKVCVLADSALKNPFGISLDENSSLKKENNQADYIVITHQKFTDALKPLVDFRRSGGLNVKVVKARDIYDEFNYGIFSPRAIKDFLEYAHTHWRNPKPTFVLLVGDATFDYQDFWQLGYENLVPAYLVYSPDFGETVSDNWFVDFNYDTLPEMFIGRLPVKDEAQLGAVIDKILNYERLSFDANWAQELLFVADDSRDFEEVSDSLVNLLPSGLRARKLRLSELGAVAVRQGIFDELEPGKLVFNYTGHAGVSLLSGGSIFKNSDVGALQNGARLPVFLAQACLNGYFIYPEGMNSLAEVLLTQADRGAIACISPSGLSSTPEQKIFSEGFYKALFEIKNEPPVLGALHFAAKEYLYDQKSLIGSDIKTGNILQTYNLLGDPALILRKSGASFSQYDRSLLLYLQSLLK